jgi:hypothetical protein
MAEAAGESARERRKLVCRMVLFISLSYTGMKRPASDARNLKSNAFFEDAMSKPQAKQFVICVKNDGYGASLEKRKLYVALRDAGAEKHGLIRVVDESGDDYLYPKVFFRSVALPQSLKKAVLAAA